MKPAATIAGQAYVNSAVDDISQRILGRYQNGLGKGWEDPHTFTFCNDGAVNFPYLSGGLWFLTQHKRWGMLQEDVDYLAMAQQIHQIDLYKEAAGMAKVRVPQSPLRTSTLIDGTVWDGKNPDAYAASFKIKA